MWKEDLGAGYGAIVSDGDTLYVPYRKDDREYVAALNSESGAQIWERSWEVTFPKDMDRSFGSGPNSTPLYFKNRVIVASTDGRLMCLSAKSGGTIWELDLYRTFGHAKRQEEYGYSGNLLIWNGKLIVPIGGDKARVVVLHVEDGQVAWKSGEGAVSYAPASLASLQGKTQYFYFSPTDVVSLDPETGTELWSHPCTCFTGNNLTPAIQCDDEHVWVAGQLDAGTRLIKLVQKSDRTETEVVWEDKRLTQAHWNSIVIGDVLYGCEGGNYESRFAAIDWRTGEILWQRRGHALAKPVRVGPQRLAWVADSGRFTLADVSSEGLNVVGEMPFLEAKSWTPITIEGIRVYGRDQNSIIAVELSSVAMPQEPLPASETP